MGKRRIDSMKKIADEKTRQTTFCKRKRGLLKKAIELSQLCDQHIFIVIFDENKQRLVEFSSSPEFSGKVAERLVDPCLPSNIDHEKYSNSDLELFSINKKDSISNHTAHSIHSSQQQEEQELIQVGQDRDCLEPPKKFRKLSGRPPVPIPLQMEKLPTRLQTAVEPVKAEKQTKITVDGLRLKIELGSAEPAKAEMDLSRFVRPVSKKGRGPSKSHRQVNRVRIPTECHSQVPVPSNECQVEDDCSSIQTFSSDEEGDVNNQRFGYRFDHQDEPFNQQNEMVKSLVVKRAEFQSPSIDLRTGDLFRNQQVPVQPPSASDHHPCPQFLEDQFKPSDSFFFPAFPPLDEQNDLTYNP